MRKSSKASKPSSRIGLRLAALLGIAGFLGGAVWGVVRLRDLWLAPCRVTDSAEQIVLEGNEYVPADAILGACGLTNGVNLARLAPDFAKIRLRLLARIPNLRDVSFTHRHPNRLEVRVAEREPVARMNLRGGPRRTGRVVDAEGVVFLRTPGTQLLPEIWEPSATPKGKQLDGRSRAALDVVNACRDPELEKLNLRAVDAAPFDYLVISFGSARCDRAKVDWEGRGQATEKARKALRKTLLQLKQAYDTHLGERAVMWNATVPDRVFANTMEPIQ
ncbi:MAG TPA: hypothetical protein DD637_04725 [Verrucomicrobia bacterium]|nr:hypothetical protein [Verrucomicrobiota bacterium]HCG20149.1 hypothetical protein [Verrucomicrobiota bacterium]